MSAEEIARFFDSPPVDPPDIFVIDFAENFPYFGLPLNPGMVNEDGSMLYASPDSSATTSASMTPASFFPSASDIPGTVTPRASRKIFPPDDSKRVVATSGCGSVSNSLEIVIFPRAFSPFPEESPGGLGGDRYLHLLFDDSDRNLFFSRNPIRFPSNSISTLCEEAFGITTISAFGRKRKRRFRSVKESISR
jgi:hypothetical protein